MAMLRSAADTLTVADTATRLASDPWAWHAFEQPTPFDGESRLMRLLDSIHGRVSHARSASEIPYLPCHWCEATGVHPFVPARWRQLLALWLEVPEFVDSESGRHELRWIEGVSKYRPFRLWHTEVMIEVARGALLPYDLPGGPMACARCAGWGELNGALRYGEQSAE